MKFSVAIREYVEWKNLRGVQFRTGRGFLETLQRRTGDRPLSDITPEKVLAYLDGEELTPGVWWRRYRVLHRFFEFWVVRGEISRLPMPRPRAAWPEPFKPYIYSRQELRRLLKATRSFQFGHWVRLDPLTLRAVILFLYGTGARLRETLALRVGDLDLKNSVVRLGNIAEGRARSIPFGSNLKRHLRRYLKARASWSPRSSNLFVDKQGKAVIDGTLRSNFQRLRRRAGIHPRSGRPPGFRDLRHTFAVHRLTAMLNERKNPRSLLPALSAYMGHVKWIWAERYLALAPERFWNQLAMIGPIRAGGNAKNGHFRSQEGVYGTCSVLPPRVRWQMAPGADRGKNPRGTEAVGLRHQQD